MSRTEIRVIRPLAYNEERRISLEAARLGPSGDKLLLSLQFDTKRLSAKNLLKEMEKEMPELKSNVIHALRNVKGNDVWW